MKVHHTPEWAFYAVAILLLAAFALAFYWGAYENGHKDAMAGKQYKWSGEK